MQQTHNIIEGGNQVHFLDYLRVLNKRKVLIVTVCVIVIVLSLILGLREKTVYTSSSTVLIERDRPIESMGFSIFWDPEFIPTQTEIIKSKTVARGVVESLHLDSKYYDHFLPATENKDSLLGGIKKTITGFISGFFLPGNDMDTSSGSDAKEVDKVDLIASVIMNRVTVEPVKRTKILNIYYSDSTPEMARMITDALVDSFIKVSVEIKLGSQRRSLQWMTTKAEDERRKLEKTEYALQKYKRENNLVTVENKLDEYSEKISQFNTGLSEVRARLKQLEDLYAQMQLVKDTPEALETIPALAQNESIVSLSNQILKAEQLIRELSKKYGPKHPNMIKAVADRNILIRGKNQSVQRVIELTRKEHEMARLEKENLQELLASAKNELLDYNERYVQFSIMKREVEANRALYDALTANLKKTDVTDESQSISIWVVRPASLSQQAMNIKISRILMMGLLLGIAGGAGLAFFIEYLDNTIKTAEELEQRYGMTVLGSVQMSKKGDVIETAVIDNSRSPVSENYRMIRSSLLLSSADHPPRTLLVTSMTPQDGKTTTAINLARTMAQISDKVLLIDADMRRPRLHILLGLSNNLGLSSFLSGSVDEKEIRNLTDENVNVITSGPIPPNPAELLSSNRMQDLLRELASIYDFIIIDSPPIGQLADALIISTKVDGTVLVVRAGKTTYEMFSSGLKKMLELQPHILGVILNGVSSKISGSTSYQYYDYYTQDND